MISKIRVNVDALSKYYADYRCIPELLKILQLLFNGNETNSEVQNQKLDFTLPFKFDKRKTKEITKEI